jgi:hypothetical protein
VVRVAFSILYRFNVNFPEKNIQKYADSLFVIYFIYIILVKTVIYNICELVKIIIIKNNKIIIIYYIKIKYIIIIIIIIINTHTMGKGRSRSISGRKKILFLLLLLPHSPCAWVCAQPWLWVGLPAFTEEYWELDTVRSDHARRASTCQELAT